jgi:hypothetical protein
MQQPEPKSPLRHLRQRSTCYTCGRKLSKTLEKYGHPKYDQVICRAKFSLPEELLLLETQNQDHLASALIDLHIN